MPITITVVSRTSTSITVEARHTDALATRIYFDYLSNGQYLNRGYELTNANVYRQFTFTNFSPETFYTLRARSVNGNNLQDISSATTIGSTLADSSGEPTYVTPTPTNINITQTSGSEVLISWNPVSGANYYSVNMTFPQNNNYIATNSSIYVGNLSSNQTYSFNIRAFSNAGGFSSYSSTISITLTSVRPNNFNWTFSKNSNSNFYVGADEWNTLTGRINSFRSYRGLSSVNFTQVQSDDIFFSTYFNQARNAINELNSSVPITKNTGDIINASDLNQLVSALNNVN